MMLHFWDCQRKKASNIHILLPWCYSYILNSDLSLQDQHQHSWSVRYNCMKYYKMLQHMKNHNHIYLELYMILEHMEDCKLAHIAKAFPQVEIFGNLLSSYKQIHLSDQHKPQTQYHNYGVHLNIHFLMDTCCNARWRFHLYQLGARPLYHP